MRILHVCESVIGGPASYFEEILPFQSRQFSPENVIVLAPDRHRSHLGPAIDCVVETYHRSGRNFRSLLALAAAIRSAVRRHDPDVVHFHSSFAGAVGRAVMLALRHHAKIVYCAHCWSFDRPAGGVSRLWIPLERALARATDAIVNLSPHEDELLDELGFPAGKAVLIVSGLSDLSSVQRVLPATPRDPAAPLRLLFVGRLDVQKGVDLLLEDFARISPERATLRLVGGSVVGGDEPNIPPGVVRIGWVARDRLPALLEACDAVIMPSRWEGMPLWALEVMRAGRPLIASAHGPFPYLVEDGVNGVLVDIDKPGFVGRALRVLEGSDLVAMGAAARATYEAKFGPDRMNHALVSLYLSLSKSVVPSDRPPADAAVGDGRPSEGTGAAVAGGDLEVRVDGLPEVQRS